VQLSTIPVDHGREAIDAAADRSTRLSAWWIGAAAAMFVADLFLHLPITDFCDALVKKVGWVAYDNFLRRGFFVLGITTTAIVAAWPRRRTAVNAVAIASLFVAAVVAQHTLLVAGIENIHYPQYAMVAFLLLQGGVRPEVGLLAAAALGAADETYQFLALPRGRPTYFDWNDVVLNALGSAFGLVFARAFTRIDRSRALLPTTRVLKIVGVALVIGLIVGPPLGRPFFTVTPGGRLFHQLAASEAVLLLGSLWMGMRALLRSGDGERDQGI
jgi:hypothetical protein